MASHEFIPVSKISEDTREAIKKEGKLVKCPVCGEIFSTEMCCSFGNDIQRSLNLKIKDQQACEKCQIIWQLKELRWVNERNDGMITGRGVDYYLSGVYNCFCRYPVFQVAIEIPVSSW